MVSREPHVLTASMERDSYNRCRLRDRFHGIDCTMLPTTNKKTAKTATAVRTSSSSVAPCGACKYLRRKCVSGCVFAAHFGSEQGTPARFAAVHKVFGACNVSKLLKLVPPSLRHDAVLTLCYEAQARLCDPVLGCVSTVLALNHQVVQLQTELSIVQSQLINSKLAAAAAAEAFQYSETLQQLMTVQPACSNSSVSNNLNISSFPYSALDFCDSQSLELLQRSQRNKDDEEEVEDSTYQNPEAFSNGMFHSK